MTHRRQQSRNEIIAELEEAGAVVLGNKIKCPFHDDQNPSAGVFQGQDGIWRFHCHGCGAKGDIFDLEAKRTGRPLAEILKENAQVAPRSTNARQAEPSRPSQSRSKAWTRFTASCGASTAAIWRHCTNMSLPPANTFSMLSDGGFHLPRRQFVRSSRRSKGLLSKHRSAGFFTGCLRS